MPDLPLAQQLYLGGVLSAFAAFTVTLAWAYFQSNRRSAQPQRGLRSAEAGQDGEGRAVVKTHAPGAFQADRA